MSGPSSPHHPSDALQEIHPVVAMDQSVAMKSVVETGLNSSSYASAPIQEDKLKYLYASNTNVCNFVSVKLSSEGNYHLWKTQMLCLMDSHNMVGLVDDAIIGPRCSSVEMERQYNSLLKGWIFGSVSQDVLGAVVDLPSAKDVWEKLKSFYDATVSLQQDTITTDIEENYKDPDLERAAYHEMLQELGRQLKEVLTITLKEELEKLQKATLKGDWHEAESIIQKYRRLVTEAITNDGSNILHIAVGKGHNHFVKKLLTYMEDDDILEERSSDGSTALHIAAIVGNRYAAHLLVEKDKRLLRTKDHNGQEPLQKAYEHMHLDTFGYLFEVNDDETTANTDHSGVEIGVDLLINAIFAKKYILASELIVKFPKLAVTNDGVLMALAKTFPSGLDYVQTFIYPSFDSIWEGIRFTYVTALDMLQSIKMTSIKFLCCTTSSQRIKIKLVPLMIPYLVIILTYFLLFMVWFMFRMLYFFMWKAASMIVPRIKHIEIRKGEWEAAEKVLLLVCDKIDELEFSGTNHSFYTAPILEATCQNVYKVVDEILFRSPETINCKDKSGYDIIQLAILHRSHEIYNLIYDIGERKNIYRTIVDSSKNNILHLAGKLAPSHKLSRITGAALQLQRELQWREEVKELVFPTYITRENIFKETPDMVFTREHANLLKEGEKWIKTTAESSSITAALITTIVFAAAITVPGGTHQETGIPLFKKDIAFTVFAISDAISLFASSTALLVFLSILTARFAEKDFLVSLPRRLLIGICALLLSTTAMMVAFSATLFIVFCDQKPWMLAPICGLAFIPILFFIILQFPLIVDLFRSTYIPIFGKQWKSASRRFNPDNIRFSIW